MGFGREKSPSARTAHETRTGPKDGYRVAKKESVFNGPRGFELQPIFGQNADFKASCDEILESHFGLINGAGRRFSRE